MRQLVLATRNAHKTREFSEILGSEFVVRDLSGESEMPVLEETGSTFAENAILKAVATSNQIAELVVADDSGLEVDALDGAPGIYSARYAGAAASDQDNIALLLSELMQKRAMPPITARFRCVLALARTGQLLAKFDGVVEGTIVESPRGNLGFGYDPIFQPIGSTKTFAELTPDEKNGISHRARAIRQLGTTLSSEPTWV